MPPRCPRGPAASISLPLDIGAAIETIPTHLRRAVITRDRHCRFPGRRQRPAACLIHHLVPHREAGLLTSRRQGTWVHYRIAPDIVAAMGQMLTGTPGGPASPGGIRPSRS